MKNNLQIATDRRTRNDRSLEHGVEVEEARVPRKPQLNSNPSVSGRIQSCSGHDFLRLYYVYYSGDHRKNH